MIKRPALWVAVPKRYRLRPLPPARDRAESAAEQSPKAASIQNALSLHVLTCPYLGAALIQIKLQPEGGALLSIESCTISGTANTGIGAALVGKGGERDIEDHHNRCKGGIFLQPVSGGIFGQM
jgi:hypothetical protein